MCIPLKRSRKMFSHTLPYTMPLLMVLLIIKSWVRKKTEFNCAPLLKISGLLGPMHRLNQRFEIIQLMLLVACVQQLDSSSIKVNTKWTYINERNHTRSLPDFIRLDLEFESDKIILNLIKQSPASLKAPFIITQVGGQRSEWNPSDDELIGVYKDPSLDAYATVNVNKFDGRKETLYMITFTHGNKSLSLEPSDFFSPSLYKIDQDPISGNDKKSIDDIKSNNNNKNKIKLLNIDGRLHSLVEIPTTKSHPLDKDHIKSMTREARVRKRSTKMAVEKRLMTVEVFTIIDHTIFNKFFNESKATSICKKKREARKNIFYYFTHVIEGVKINYENIELEDLKFTVKWVGALITESIEDASFFENNDSRMYPKIIDAIKVLGYLDEWANNEKAKGKDEAKLPNFDSVVLFTRNMMIKVNISVNGLAYHGICKYPSIAIIKQSNIYSDIVLTSHELGHNLDMEHDGSNDNGCDPLENFILAPYVQPYSSSKAKNMNFFSRCSLSYLNETVNKLDRDKINCLADGGDDFNRGPERDIFLSLYPGQIYELEDQCKMVYGPKSFYCGGFNKDQKMCQVIKCFDGKACRFPRELNAMDGTTCGNRSWCLRGECVYDINAPRAPNQCVNGDIKLPPFKNITELYCHNIRKDMGSLCSHKDGKKYCCASCQGGPPQSTVEDCQDIVEECPSLEPRDCYSNYYAITCCKTCRSLVQNPSDANCLYGDKGVGCLDLLPTVCHLSPTRYCCKTCSAYLSSTKTTNVSLSNQ